ncbi:MAG: bifunctional folylpolyglutamate synthase/dihydrofolate synthase, partial [candidate division Zixibacteria bacterium]|nr:bifunctional folylpolyglutamate synthase/dihydrofolate synthase [candidate division Zixibacteria bacterium]
GIKLDLSNTISLTNHLGNPHLKFPCIHIAGSNGKGSVAAILHSILSATGYRAGLYTSPHLVDYRERIRIGEELIDKSFIFDFVNDLKDDINKNGYTFFEVTTALAFSYFANKKVDIAVLETGMGGRLDSTNIVTPLISIITDISLEHTNHLGTTLPQIAFEKAGIIKNEVPTITSIEDQGVFRVIKDVCAQRKSPLSSAFLNSAESPVHGEPVQGEPVVGGDVKIQRLSLDQTIFDFGQYKNLELNLCGRHQVTNACLAISAVEKLKEMGWEIESKAVREALKNVDWRARLEIFERTPLTLLDVAHNPAGTKALVDALDELFPKKKKIIFIFGVMADKDYASMLKEICRKAILILLTKPDYKRAADPELLKEVVIKQNKPYEIFPQVKQAYLFALKNAKSEDVICITGSHFTVG